MNKNESPSRIERRKAIVHALLEELANKRLEDVKPTDICRRCGISRSTFYRSFSSIMDIPIWYRNYGAELGMYRIGKIFTCRQGHLVSLRLLADTRPLFEYYSKTPCAIDAEFLKAATSGHVTAMTKVLKARGVRINLRTQYELEAVAGGCFVATSRWLGSNMDLPVSEMANVLVELYPSDLLEIFDQPSEAATTIDEAIELLLA